MNWVSLRVPGICVYLREPQHTPWSKHTPGIPKHTPKWKEFLHKMLVERLGYVPGVCWKILGVYEHVSLLGTITYATVSGKLGKSSTQSYLGWGYVIVPRSVFIYRFRFVYMYMYTLFICIYLLFRYRYMIYLYIIKASYYRILPQGSMVGG